MVYGPEAELDSDFEEAESDDDEEIFTLGEGADLRAMAMEMMDDNEPADSGPIVSVNEMPLPPVAQPPIVKLPEGERLNLAGDVVSWMRDKKAEAWVARVAAGDAAKEDSGNAGSVSTQVSKDAAEATTTAAPEAQGDTSLLDEEDEVELGLTGGPDDDESADVAPKATPEQIEPVVEMPKLHSSGTVIIRAMQNLPATGEDGWLEEGSVVCFEDGRVLGTVSRYHISRHTW
jgi:H/ACA ribonucleoprotein complex non-core subunit NAF1